MATRRTSFPRPNPRRPPVTARRIALAVVAAAGVVLVPLPASAAPDPTTAREAADLMAARGHDLEVVTEKFNTAREELAAQQATADAAAAAFDRARADLVAAQGQVRGIARSAFTGEGLNGFAALLTSGSAQEFVDRVSMLDMVAGHQNEIIGQVAGVARSAAEAQTAAAKAAADARATYDAVAKQQADLQAQINEYQADFNRLSAQEQRAALAGHGGDRASRADRGSFGPIVASSQAAQTAVDTAMAQRGKPYVWGAAGPDSYDCSGLVQYAYRAAGISLPHSSAQQAQMGRAVSRAQLQPGDLVAYYSPVSHIGIYIGNGQIVHAPTSGDVVKVASIDAVGNPTALRRLAG